jgi:hypothetical protein
MHIGDGSADDGVAPYDSAQFDATNRILTFNDGQLGDGQTFTTNSRTGQIIVAARPTSNMINGDFSLKIGANMGRAAVPEPGSAMIFALGGLVMLVDRRRK